MTGTAAAAISIAMLTACAKSRRVCSPFCESGPFVSEDGTIPYAIDVKSDGEWIPFPFFSSDGQTISSTTDGLALTFSEKNTPNLIDVRVRNESGADVRIEGLSVGNLWPAGAAESWLAEGYQSWSLSPIVSNDLLKQMPVPDRDKVGAHNTDLLTLDPLTSWWHAQPPEPDAYGATVTARAWKTRFLHPGSGPSEAVTLVQGATGDSKHLASGESVAFEDMIRQSPPLLAPPSSRTYPRRETPLDSPGPEPPFLPVGWNSWNTLFDAVTEEDILVNARFIKENLPDMGINNIQVDDGWELDWGRWEANEKFPSGMDGVARKIRDLGFIPGIWFAPFLVDETSPVALDHPDWFLTDFEGTRITYPIANMGGGSTKLMLDTTYPEAREWMLGQIRKLVGWGYRYLKLDFLFAAAVEGRRFDAGKTSLEAYREAMTAIGEAAGPDVYILASGAPILPTIGLAHGIRVGPDIAFFTLPYEWRYIKAEVLNLATRHFLYPAIAPDPDTALIRDIPENEARYYLTATLMAPDIFAIGDNLPSLPASKLDLYRRAGTFLRLFFDETTHTVGEFSIPDLFEFPAHVLPKTNFDVQLVPNSYPIPTVWVRRAGEATAVALLNDGESNAVIRAEIGGSYQAEELWSGTKKSISGVIEEEIGPHDARLYILTPN